MSRIKDNRDKLVQERLKQILDELLRSDDNRYCADCNTKGPRWASHNLGVFVCIRCAGIHRNLGVHISKVKSVALDTWTPEQVATMKEMGNSRGRAIYEAGVHDGFHRPQSDMEVERLIRDKYDKKKFIAKEWKPSVNKPDVASLGLDEVMFGRKSSKPSAPTSAVVLPPPTSAAASAASASLKQKLAISPSNPDRMSQVKVGADVAASTSAGVAPTPANSSSDANTIDLLGLSLDEGPSLTGAVTAANGKIGNNDKNNNDDDDDDDDDFGNFLTAPAVVAGGNSAANEPTQALNNNNNENDPKSKDSIMALFPSIPQNNNNIPPVNNNNTNNFGHMSSPMIPSNNSFFAASPASSAAAPASMAPISSSSGANVMASISGNLLSDDLLGLGKQQQSGWSQATPLGGGVNGVNGVNGGWMNANNNPAASSFGMAPAQNSAPAYPPASGMMSMSGGNFGSGMAPSSNGLAPNGNGMAPNANRMASNANGMAPNGKGMTPGSFASSGGNLNLNGLGSFASVMTPSGSGAGANAMPSSSNIAPIGGSMSIAPQQLQQQQHQPMQQQSNAFQSANPFFNPPSGSSQPNSHSQTQVSWASAAHLQQQQQMQQQMQQQFPSNQAYQQHQYSQFQQQQHQGNFNGMQVQMTNQMGNVTNQYQVNHQVQQQMSTMKMTSSTGGFNSLAKSTISFLD